MRIDMFFSCYFLTIPAYHRKKPFSTLFLCSDTCHPYPRGRHHAWREDHPGQADQEVMRGEEFAPFIIEQRAVRLKRILNAHARTTVLLLQFNSQAKEIQAPLVGATLAVALASAPIIGGIYCSCTPFTTPSLSLPNLRICGQIRAIASTTSIVPMPPDTTEMIGPKNCATRPDSKPPSSLDAPTNRLLTAATRPRRASGVRVSTSVPRITTLTLSRPPNKNSIASESQNERERPKTIVASPKPATAHSKLLPALLKGGECAIINETQSAPIDGAARSQPRPVGPTRRISLAKIGSSVVAPPSKTANKSSVIAASITCVWRRKVRPSFNELSVVVSFAGTCRRITRSKTTSTRNTSAARAFKPYTSHALFISAITKPPEAGPSTAASCHELLLHVAALSKAYSGTTCGSNVDEAGLLKAIAMPSNSKLANINTRDPCVSESSIKPSEAIASTSWVMTTIVFRLYRSARCPAGRDSRITGSTCTSPTRPSTSAERARSSSSQPTATLTIS